MATSILLVHLQAARVGTTQTIILLVALLVIILFTSRTFMKKRKK